MDSRQAHFATGVVGETPSLEKRSLSFNDKVSHGFRPNGLNQPFMLSPGNGNSPADAARQTPSGQLPSENGMSSSTYQQLVPHTYGINLNL